MRKFKHAENGRIVMFSTDENGDEIPETRTDFGPTDKPRTMGHGFYQEYLKHIEDGGEVEPLETPEEIATREAKEAAESLVAYRGLRASDYPPIGDQLDYIYHHGLTKWKNDMITPVKEKWPKP